MKVNIVGLHHRNLTYDFISKIGKSEISFKCEIPNKYDKNAVQCISHGVHFGYIEKDKSEYISTLINSSTPFSYKILSKDEYKVCLELTIRQVSHGSSLNTLKVNTTSEVKIPKDANHSGIYRIKFAIDDVKLSYIGQSSNISKRIQSHLKELKNQTHHNKKLQNGWLSNPSSFEIEVLYKSTDNSSALNKQIELFEKELYYIELEGGKEVNLIDGDLVFTKDSIDEFNVMIKEFKKVVKQTRKIENHKKEMLGKLILDLRIMDRADNGLTYSEVKDTNVITWLNKKRYSPLDYVPKIRYEVIGSKELIDAIQELNSKLKNISIHTVFADDFKKSLFEKRRTYETCDRKKLKLFIDTMKDYQKGRFGDSDISKYTTVSNRRISYDSSLLEIFDKSFLESLVPFVG